jgi:hypothetical protein
MLEAMGWKAGTGLGAKLEGIVDPLDLRILEPRQGLGFRT